MESEFMKVNMSMVSNQNVYPTRDVSGNISIDHYVKSTPVQKQGNEKGDKEKSFIKLLSNKKDVSMISKNWGSSKALKKWYKHIISEFFRILSFLFLCHW